MIGQRGITINGVLKTDKNMPLWLMQRIILSIQLDSGYVNCY